MSEKHVHYGGVNLRKARLNADIWTQKELAERTGISPSIISDLERGLRAMSPRWAMKIAKEVGVNYRTLLDSDGE